MGSCQSCFTDTYTQYPEIKQWETEFEALKLTSREVRQMYKLFMRIDSDGSGSIQINEMLDFIDLDRNKFSERVFSIFDQDDSKCIDFKEFAITLWNYCTLGNTTLILFAFDLYDKDSSGVIDAAEVDLMLKEIYGHKFQKNIHAHRISEKIGSLAIEDVNKDVFAEFIRNHPALIFPAFTMQQMIRKKCMGRRFWNKVSKRRIEITHGQFLSVDEIVKLLNNAVMEKKIEQKGTACVVDFETILDPESEKHHRAIGRRRHSNRDNKRGSNASTTSYTDTLSESSPMKHIEFIAANTGTHHKRRQSSTQNVLSVDSAECVVPIKRDISKSSSRRETFPSGESTRNLHASKGKPRAFAYEDLALSSFNDDDCHVAPLQTDLSRRMSSVRLKPSSTSNHLNRDLSKRGSSKRLFSNTSSFNGNGSPTKKMQVLPEPQAFYKELSSRMPSNAHMEESGAHLSRRMSSTRMKGAHDRESSIKRSRPRRHSDASIPTKSDVERLGNDVQKIRRVSIY